MTFGTLNFAAVMAGLAAALHLVLVLWAGPGEAVMAAAMILAALGLRMGWRWFGWLVMLVLIVVCGVSLARLSGGPVPAVAILALIAVQGLAIASLFVSLWRPRDATA